MEEEMKKYKRGKHVYRLIRANEDWSTTWYFIQDIKTEKVIAVGKKVFEEEFTEVEDELV